MDGSRRNRWLLAAMVAGVVYLIIGRTFALPSDHVREWRVAAWLFSAVAYAIHIWYERFRVNHPPRSAAFHVAIGVAIGGFGIALAGMLNSLSKSSAITPNWLLALILFPAVTAIPAFLVAWALAALTNKVTPTVDQ